MIKKLILMFTNPRTFHIFQAEYRYQQSIRPNPV